MFTGMKIFILLLVLVVAGVGAEAIDMELNGTKPVEQHILCDRSEIPEGVTPAGLAERSERCCGSDTGLVLHMQRNQDRIDDSYIIACLPATTCPPGEIAILYQNESHASMKCTPCSPGGYQPTASKSQKQRHAVCPEVHRKCGAEYGFAEVTVGNRTHDYSCRCLWEEGYAPSIQTEQCTNPEGFNGNSNCDCKKAACLENGRMVLNDEFKCVPKPLSTEEPVTSTEEVQETATLRDITPKHTWDGENMDDERNWTTSQILCLSSVVVGLLICAVLLICKFHPRTRGRI